MASVFATSGSQAGFGYGWVVGQKSAWQAPFSTRCWHPGAPTHSHLPEVRYYSSFLFYLCPSLCLELASFSAAEPHRAAPLLATTTGFICGVAIGLNQIALLYCPLITCKYASCTVYGQHWASGNCTGDVNGSGGTDVYSNRMAAA